ncbi:MAG: ATP synthase F0 subunit B [Acidobacteriota bacterium]|nr:ATP synthase F0 subunit B [Acidobacteriota bacterium]
MPDLSLLAVMVIFVLEYIIVSRYFLGPINDVLESREAEARSAQEIYEQSLGRFNEETDRIEQRIHEAKRDAAQLREKFRADAGAHRASLVERTTNDGQKLVAEADKRLSRDVKEAREKIVHDAESLARLAAERILGRPL